MFQGRREKRYSERPGAGLSRHHAFLPAKLISCSCPFDNVYDPSGMASRSGGGPVHAMLQPNPIDQQGQRSLQCLQVSRLRVTKKNSKSNRVKSPISTPFHLHDSSNLPTPSAPSSINTLVLASSALSDKQDLVSFLHSFT